MLRILKIWTDHQSARVWLHLGWRDLKIRYASTKIGPWWSAANLFATIMGSSLAVGLLSGKGALSQAPRLALGLSIWTLISASLVEATSLYEDDKSLLLNTSIAEKSLVYRLVWRNLIIFAHNFLIVIFVFIISGNYFPIEVVYLIPIALLTSVALLYPIVLFAQSVYWVPDLRAILPPFIQFSFFLTPVLWEPPTSGPGKLLLELNPAAWFLHFSQTVILHNNIPWSYLLRMLIFVGISVGGLSFSTTMMARVRKRL
jgi:ABC-type polysaccharide/polyol phosphate export permease